VTALLELAAEGAAPVALVDRDWCQACPAGGSKAPWSDSIAEANRLLALVGKSALAITVYRRPTPDSVALPIRRQALGRRGLLTALRPKSARDPVLPPRGRARISPRVPRRRAALLRRLSARADGALPAAALPSAVIGAGCCHRAVCAAACPTGALSTYEDATGVGIAFDATACIGCAECARRCPEQALRFQASGQSIAAAHLSHHRTATCIGCGERFIAKGGEDRCEPCHRSLDLSREAFMLVRSRPAGRGEPVN
jgi:ferredoxin